jgi:sugar phosphate isomerase/epimerase
VRTDQIALQLYTVRGLAATDLPGTLRSVRAAGYEAVELAGLPPIDAHELADLLAATGVRPMGAHESIDGLRRDAAAVADRLVAVECPRVIVPWLPEADRSTVDEARRVARELAELARTMADRGLRFGYHNHAFEFTPLDGTVDGPSLWDVLIAELPAEVDLELDVYWASVAGRDPVELVRAAAGRVRLLHMKDRAPGAEPHDAPPGAGILPWPELVAAARDAAIEWYVVEQDDPADALADIRSGRRYLAGLATDPASASA